MLWFFLATAAVSAEPRKGAIQETWDAAYLQDVRAGFVHTTANEFVRDGRTMRRTTQELNLNVRRFNDTLSLRMETTTEETEDGKVVAVSMRQFAGQSQQRYIRATVNGNYLHIKVDNSTASGAASAPRGPSGAVSAPQAMPDKKIPWKEDVLGLSRQERIFQERQVKPGDEFSYYSYDPTITAVLKIRATVKNHEPVDMLDTLNPEPAATASGIASAPRGPSGVASAPRAATTKKPRRLLRVETMPDRVHDIQLPPTTLWLDDDLLPVKSKVDMPGLGQLTLYRTTREAALKRSTSAPEIGFTQLIGITQAIPAPYATQEASYRITIRGDNNPSTAFATDDRQRIKLLKDQTIELTVRARRDPKPLDPGQVKPADEFLTSCYFINSGDDKVRELARHAVGTETDPWKKALRIERWVYENIRKKNFKENFAPADRVARSLQGDCTEHALLSAAMCRAVGVPSRAAIGLLYVERSRRPAFGFHMWTEVWVGGQWMPFDGTLGRGYVGATHLKISDHSWSGVASMAPLLPVLRILGKISIEVISVKGIK
jgi:hypothetical protein